MDTLLELLQKNKLEFQELAKRLTIPRGIESKVVTLIEDSQIKVILGPRRAGKSTIAINSYKRFFSNDHNSKFNQLVYLNFDDSDLISYRHQEILNAISINYPDSKFILFDEIQNLPKWELLLNKLQRTNFKCLVTGSNANLLSKELATHLTGRHISFEVLPFAFGELRNKVSYQDFSYRGGYPEVILKDSNDFRDRQYLDSLVRSIIYRDIAVRYKIRNYQELERTIFTIINNHTLALSMRGLKDVLGLKSDLTVKKYIGYLEDAYVVIPLSIFAHNYRVQTRNPRKFYLVDQGIYTFLNSNTAPNLGRRFENLVFLELRKNIMGVGRKLFYYRTRSNREIDFLLLENNKVTRLVQACLEMSDFETKAREFEALVEASNELNCHDLVIITENESYEEVFKGKKIRVIKFEEFF